MLSLEKLNRQVIRPRLNRLEKERYNKEGITETKLCEAEEGDKGPRGHLQSSLPKFCASVHGCFSQSVFLMLIFCVTEKVII